LHTLREEHSKRYLNKMIQIEIAVPKIEPEVLAKLAKSEEDKDFKGPQKKSWREHWQEYRKGDETLKREYRDRPKRFLNKKAIPTIFLLMVLASGFLMAVVSKILIADFMNQAAQAKILVVEQKIQKIKNGEIKTDEDPEVALSELILTRQSLAEVVEQTNDDLVQAESDSEIAISGVGISVGLFSLAFVLVLGGKSILQDSENYKKALNILAPIMALKDPNPRHLKRLVNLLRLISMRDKDKSGNKNNHKAGENPSNKNKMPELEERAVKFVLLMTLEELEIELIDFIKGPKETETQKGINESSLTDFVNALTINHKDKKGWLKREPEAREKLVKAIMDFHTEFPYVWPTEDDVERYREFLGDVVLREV